MPPWDEDKFTEALGTDLSDIYIRGKKMHVFVLLQSLRADFHV